MSKILIVVRGGVVTTVYGSEDWHVLDWDDIAEGTCPLCGGTLSDDVCTYCETDYNNATSEQIYKVFIQD